MMLLSLQKDAKDILSSLYSSESQYGPASLRDLSSPSDDALPVMTLDLSSLITDVLIEIFRYLEIRDILSMRLTSRRFQNITMLREVWLNTVHEKVFGRGLQLPGRTHPDLLAHSVSTLESLTRHAAQLSENWAQPSPTPTSVLEFDERVPNGYITQIHFLPGRAAKYLITVSSASHVISWEIVGRARRARMMAEWKTDGVILDVVVNTKEEDEAALAISTMFHGIHSVEVLTFNPQGNEDTIPVFTLLRSTTTMGRLKSLRGDLLTFYKRMGATVLVDWRTGNQGMLKRQNEPSRTLTASLAMEFCYGAVLIVTSHTIELYQKPELVPFVPSPSARLPPSEGRPLGYLEFPQEARSAAITPYVRLLADGSDPSGRTHPDRPLSILLRLKEGPRDEIRHYVLRPALFPLSPSAPDYTPYEFPPQLIQVRTANPHFYADIQINPSGRGFWVENFTAVNVGRPREHLVGFLPGERKRKGYDEGDEWETGSELIDIEAPYKILGVQHDVLKCTDCSYDDATGRIAIGSYNGKVKILDFA